MDFTYQDLDPSGRLSQGEILWGVSEPIPVIVGEGDTLSEQVTEVKFIEHPQVAIVNADCDLLSDFFLRFPVDIGESENQKQPNHLLSHVLCCEAYTEEEARRSVAVGSDLWKRISRNQNERYQRIPSGLSMGILDSVEPEYFFDFKRVFSLPTELLYHCLERKQIERKGVLPPPWIQSLVNRLNYYQGRVCLPDPTDRRELLTQPSLLPGPTA